MENEPSPIKPINLKSLAHFFLTTRLLVGCELGVKVFSVDAGEATVLVGVDVFDEVDGEEEDDDETIAGDELFIWSVVFLFIYVIQNF